jgi:hypothetical protein
MAVAHALGLDLSSPEVDVPTHYPFNPELRPTVIDLVFLPTESILFDTHAILPDHRGPSDHAPLVFTAQGPDSRVPLTRWCIPRDSKEEEAFLQEASASLLALAPRRVDSVQELEEMVQAISSA